MIGGPSLYLLRPAFTRPGLSLFFAFLAFYFLERGRLGFQLFPTSVCAELCQREKFRLPPPLVSFGQWSEVPPGRLAALA